MANFRFQFRAERRASVLLSLVQTTQFYIAQDHSHRLRKTAEEQPETRLHILRAAFEALT